MMGIPVLHLETRLSDKDMKALSDYAAALSTRKPYGFGVRSSDGTVTQFCSIKEAMEICEWKTQHLNHGLTYRVVELFYEEQS